MRSALVRFHYPVNLHSGAANALRYVGWPKPLSAKAQNQCTVEPTLAPGITTQRFCLLNALALTFFDEASLHLRDHAEHGKYKVPHLATSGNVRVQHSNERVPLLTLVDQVQHVTGVAAQSVKASNDQFIAGAQELNDRFKFSPPLPTAT